ncbi:MAG TPA: hypothetical protein VK636_16725 [Gemmatimonadaceae bacterium]|nr:hypothetical protein [Gemmatimonadaceae bacterium]
MMAGPKVDGAGTAKLKTLDDATLLLQRVNGIVEQYAIAIKNGQPSSAFLMNFRRTLPSLAANLKGQFGLIADQALAINLAATRGASEAMRVRTMREGMGHLRQAIEIAVTQTKDRHAIKEQPSGAESGKDRA